jgi:hypothetical protein
LPALPKFHRVSLRAGTEIPAMNDGIFLFCGEDIAAAISRGTSDFE